MLKGELVMWKKKTWLLAVLLICVMAGIAHSETKYPARPIEIIVPFNAGGSTDLTARIEASYISKKWNSPVNVVNKPGGNTVPACFDVHRSNPDGYTLLADGNGSASMLQNAVKKLPFDVMDRTFVAMTALIPEVIIVSPESPFKSLKDLAAFAKENPDKLTWTSLGGTSPVDFVIRQFLKALNVDVSKTKPVIFTGGSQAVVQVAGGHVMVGVASVSSALPALKSGTIKILALTDTKRNQDLPDVPTTAEMGYPSVNAVQWVGISGPPKLPAAIINQWDKVLQELLNDKDIITKLRSVGARPFYFNMEKTKEFVNKEKEEVQILWSLK
jgi:tripartite-type tricarboxylate transporter receptor subunit TctC